MTADLVGFEIDPAIYIGTGMDGPLLVPEWQAAMFVAAGYGRIVAAERSPAQADVASRGRIAVLRRLAEDAAAERAERPTASPVAAERFANAITADGVFLSVLDELAAVQASLWANIEVGRQRGYRHPLHDHDHAYLAGRITHLEWSAAVRAEWEDPDG